MSALAPPPSRLFQPIPHSQILPSLVLPLPAGDAEAMRDGDTNTP